MTQRRMTPKMFKDDRAYRCYTKDEFESIIKNCTPDDEILLFIHLASTNDNAGHYSFLESGILKEFPTLKFYYVTRYNIEDAQKNNKLNLDIFSWENYQEKIGKMFLPQKISEMKEDKTNHNHPEKKESSKKIKYAIFTALWDEFKEVKELFDWRDDKALETDTTLYKIGQLKNTEKEVVACFATRPGMVEAAVICTDMINRFKPDYILMPGVCGGSDVTEFGDVIIANKVFLLGKGKIVDPKELDEDGKMRKAVPHYKGSPIDIREITDSNNNKLPVTIEMLEKEIEAIDFDDKLSQLIESSLEKIQNKINNPYKVQSEKITLRLAPMACSLSVIDKEGYFEYAISETDRKTKAVEMESYGVARAAKKANGGNCKFIIFKGVMDKTNDKSDQYKSKAAFTSAQFLKHLLEEDII